MAENLGVYRASGSGPRLVGRLSAATGEFAYDAGYLASPQAAAISLSLPLEGRGFSRSQARPYFEGLLPEGPEREAVAAALRVRPDDYLALLARYGFECVGDVMVCAEPGDLTGSYEPVDVSRLAWQLKNGAAASINGASRLSLAGTQTKVGLYHAEARSSGGRDMCGGWFRPLGGAASTHILKTRRIESSLFFEYLCMRAARTCGVEAAHVDILDLAGPIICSRRYDRRAAGGEAGARVARLHQEDFCQALGRPADSKYAEIEGGTARAVARVIRDSMDYPIRDLEAFARLTCFNYLVGNCDNHLKNMAILYSGDWSALSLAPAYDVVCTTWFPDLTRDMGMELGGQACIDEVGPEHILGFARDIGMPAPRIREICRRLCDSVAPAVRHASGEALDFRDELAWRADNLFEDIEPRRLVLECVAG